ncbi:hypothetical protein CYMTET_40861 [Cymbomonas tetramitiformis]|uniref:Uncharacterized protein n=1 Tax=Cymbomonas tetramitiformis TaxID=36881 RepID=A0AAE0C8J3_9CHLO|nr:hypothetical protein CYMTET_40861 [Cymbomonas tetramitiformis]
MKAAVEAMAVVMEGVVEAVKGVVKAAEAVAVPTEEVVVKGGIHPVVWVEEAEEVVVVAEIMGEVMAAGVMEVVA